MPTCSTPQHVCACSLDLKDIKVVTKLGGTVDDSEMVDGMVFDHKAAKSAGGPTRIENAKIGLVQFQISPPKTDLENNVIISDYAQMDRILKEERNYILSMIKKIRATGCNVLLIQKSILRDAVTELSLHYLVGLRHTLWTTPVWNAVLCGLSPSLACSQCFVILHKHQSVYAGQSKDHGGAGYRA